MNFDLANPLPSLLAIVTTGLMAVVFITFAKWGTAKIYIPGLSEIMAAV